MKPHDMQPHASPGGSRRRRPPVIATRRMVALTGVSFGILVRLCLCFFCLFFCFLFNLFLCDRCGFCGLFSFWFFCGFGSFCFFGFICKFRNIITVKAQVKLFKEHCVLFFLVLFYSKHGS